MVKESEVDNNESSLPPSDFKLQVTSEGILRHRWRMRPLLRELFTKGDLWPPGDMLTDHSFLERLGGTLEAVRLVLHNKETITLELQRLEQEALDKNLPFEARRKAHDMKAEIQYIANELTLFGANFTREAHFLSKLID